VWFAFVAVHAFSAIGFVRENINKKTRSRRSQVIDALEAQEIEETGNEEG
jgi:hypothetical protein